MGGVAEEGEGAVMSERTTVIAFWPALLVAGIAIIFMGFVGRDVGRKQMKHWQDDWYAAHPNCYNVNMPQSIPPGTIVVLHVVDGKNQEYSYWQSPPAPPPPKPCPANAKIVFLRPGETWCVPPKPKGSKRHAITHLVDDGEGNQPIISGHHDLPQPIAKEDPSLLVFCKSREDGYYIGPDLIWVHCEHGVAITYQMDKERRSTHHGFFWNSDGTPRCPNGINATGECVAQPITGPCKTLEQLEADPPPTSADGKGCIEFTVPEKEPAPSEQEKWDGRLAWTETQYLSMEDKCDAGYHKGLPGFGGPWVVVCTLDAPAPLPAEKPQ